ncbi:unnamed protein product [Cyclocybe aegerita]|uniref:Uncharacterized protein n=1 Tax=Cyclocybe aegerita TaxID=1973307 RepID=A0A8S0XQC8_CYCAE|nr:unnamed protein product [Cyclocybe aegerita]
MYATTSTQSPHFPQEILEKILDGLYDSEHVAGGPKALAASSQTCLMFRDSTPKDKKRVEELANLLAKNPDIALYFYELRLDLDPWGRPWFIANQRFFSIMCSVHDSNWSFKHLVISTSGAVQLTLQDVPEMEEMFWKPFIAPDISSLSLSLISHFPVRLLACCINLTELDIREASIAPLEPNDLPLHDSGRYPSIQSLRCGFPAQGIRRLVDTPSPKSVPYVDFTTLRILNTLVGTSGMMADAQAIIEVASHNLEELYLSSDLSEPIYYCVKNMLDLKNLHFLRVLAVDVICPHPSRKGDAVSDLAEILGTLPKQNRLEILNITCRFGEEDYPDAPENYLMWLGAGSITQSHKLLRTNHYSEGGISSDEEGEDEGSIPTNLAVNTDESNEQTSDEFHKSETGQAVENHALAKREAIKCCEPIFERVREKLAMTENHPLITFTFYHEVVFWYGVDNWE